MKEHPETGPKVFAGYHKLLKLEKVVKDENTLCQNCTYVHYECVIPISQTQCRFYKKYSDGDTYHPKALAHKLGLYVLVPSFGFVCVSLAVVAIKGEEFLSKYLLPLAIAGFSILGAMMLGIKLLGRRSKT